MPLVMKNKIIALLIAISVGQVVALFFYLLFEDNLFSIMLFSSVVGLFIGWTPPKKE